MGKAGRIPLLIAYLLNLIDYAVTAYWVNLYGTEIEANPLMRRAFENDCAWAVKIFGVGVLLALLGVCAYKKPSTAWSGIFLAVVYSLILLYHTILAAITFL